MTKRHPPPDIDMSTKRIKPNNTDEEKLEELKRLKNEAKNFIPRANQESPENINHNRILKEIEELEKKLNIYESPKPYDYDVDDDDPIIGGKSRRRRRKTNKKKTRKVKKKATKKKATKKKRKGNKKRKTRARRKH